MAHIEQNGDQSDPAGRANSRDAEVHAATSVLPSTDQLGALGLVLNAIVLWTTKYIDAVVAQLRAEGHEPRDEDIARLSPLKHANLNVLGRYSFTASTPAVGGLRPLRDPDAVELDEDDDG